MFPVFGEIFFRVVDYMIYTVLAHRIQFYRAVDAGHFCLERFGDLHSERACATTCSVDQNLLSGLDRTCFTKTGTARSDD